MSDPAFLIDLTHDEDVVIIEPLGPFLEGGINRHRTPRPIVDRNRIPVYDRNPRTIVHRNTSGVPNSNQEHNYVVRFPPPPISVPETVSPSPSHRSVPHQNPRIIVETSSSEVPYSVQQNSDRNRLIAQPPAGTSSNTKPNNFPPANGVNQANGCTTNCSICLECVMDGRNVSATICGHVFCSACILNILNEAQDRCCCPICRKSLQPRDIFRIYLCSK